MVTVVVGDVALNLGLVPSADTALEPGVSAVLQTQLSLATLEVLAYAPLAPDAAHDMGVLLYASYLYEQRGRVKPAMNPFAASGARGALSRWHDERLAYAAGTEPAPAGEPAAALPGGGAAGNLLVRGAAERSGVWETIANALAGSVGLAELATDARDVIDGAVQVDSIELDTGTRIFTFVSDNGDIASITLPRDLPTGGAAGNVLLKKSATEYDVEWGSQSGLPAGGTTGQVVKRTATGYEWADDEIAPSASGLTQNQVDARVNAVIPARLRLPEWGTDPLSATPDIVRVLAQHGVAGQAPVSVLWRNIFRIPAGGTTGQVVKKTASGGLGWADDETASSGSGLTQTQVDARVNAVIPVVRRVPSGGATGQVVKKTATGVEWGTDEVGSGGGLTQTQVDARIKTWARIGDALGIPAAAIDVASAAKKTAWRTAIGAAADTIQHLMGILTGTFPFSTGSTLANKYLKWDADGTKLLSADLPAGSGGGGLTQPQVDARIKTWARVTDVLGIPSTAIYASTATLKAAWRTAIGAQSAGQLKRLLTLPDPADYEDGDIVNVLGQLWELATQTKDSNTISDLAKPRLANFIGTDRTSGPDPDAARLEWETAAPFVVRAYLPYAATGLGNPTEGVRVETMVSSGSSMQFLVDQLSGDLVLFGTGGVAVPQRIRDTNLIFSSGLVGPDWVFSLKSFLALPAKALTDDLTAVVQGEVLSWSPSVHRTYYIGRKHGIVDGLPREVMVFAVSAATPLAMTPFDVTLSALPSTDNALVSNDIVVKFTDGRGFTEDVPLQRKRLVLSDSTVTIGTSNTGTWTDLDPDDAYAYQSTGSGTVISTPERTPAIPFTASFFKFNPATGVIGDAISVNPVVRWELDARTPDNRLAPRLTTEGLPVLSTGVLPTAAQTLDAAFTAAQLQIQLHGDTAARGATATNASPAYGRGYRAYTGYNLYECPPSPSDVQTDGWWFIAKVAGVEFVRRKLLWGGAPTAGGTSATQSMVPLFFERGVVGRDNASVRVKVEAAAAGSVNLRFDGGGQTLPAGCTIEVIEAGAYIEGVLP